MARRKKVRIQVVPRGRKKEMMVRYGPDVVLMEVGLNDSISTLGRAMQRTLKEVRQREVGDG